MTLSNKKKFNKFNPGDLIKYNYIYESLPTKYSKGEVKFGIVLDVKNIKEDIIIKILNNFRIETISSTSNVNISIVT